MIRKGSFERMKVMLMLKILLSLIRNCASRAFSNGEGLFFFSLIFFSREVGLCVLSDDHFIILYVIYEELAICGEQISELNLFISSTVLFCWTV